MTAIQQRIGAVRRFNRFYTRQIGVLRKTYLDSPYSLGEMRVLYEIAHGDGARPPATSAARSISTPGILSRVLRNFEKRGLITRKDLGRGCAPEPPRADRARRKTFAPFETALAAVTSPPCSASSNPTEQARLVAAMRTIESLLGAAPADAAASRPTFCARRATAISAGSSAATPSFTRRNTAGPSRSKACARRSSPTSSTTTTRSSSAAGSPRLNGENVGCVMLVKDDAGRRAHPAAAGRSESARARPRPAPGRRMRDVRARGRLQENHAVDAQHSHRRAPRLRESRLHADVQREEAQLGQGRRRRSIGIWSL